MLTKQRYDLILKLLEEQKSVTLTELKELLHTSESTVRRDIVALDKAGKLMKVFGGAVVLEQPVEMLQNYHFTKGFFGTNGITQKTGFTTPDANEAQVKKAAMRQCRECFVLADSSKFDRVSSVTFAGFGAAKIITEELRDGYQECENILCVFEDGMPAEQ